LVAANAALLLGGVALALQVHRVDPLLGVLALATGGLAGVATARIYRLGWDTEGPWVVAAIDGIGWLVLGAYVVFGAAKGALLHTWVHPIGPAVALSIAVSAGAALGRLLALRARLRRVVRQERP
jgi:hypothetical protein